MMLLLWTRELASVTPPPLVTTCLMFSRHPIPKTYLPHTCILHSMMLNGATWATKMIQCHTKMLLHVLMPPSGNQPTRPRGNPGADTRSGHLCQAVKSLL